MVTFISSFEADTEVGRGDSHDGGSRMKEDKEGDADGIIGEGGRVRETWLNKKEVEEDWWEGGKEEAREQKWW